MMRRAFIPLLSLLAAISGSNGELLDRDIVPPNSLPLLITKKTTFPIPKTLYGYMWEDINHSGDGGLYAELLQNRAFQAVVEYTQAALAGWQVYNAASIWVTDETEGVSAALPNSLRLDVAADGSESVGFENLGWYGIKVAKDWQYKGSFYVKSPSFAGDVTVQLLSATTGDIYFSKTFSGVKSTWEKFSFTFNPSASAPDNNNVLRFTVDAESAQGSTLYFGLFSLFPPTFRGRENGLRIDLASALLATRPGVWRFPGGNNLEGYAWNNRWKWNETIGPLENRPGRAGDWGYPNTDGIGLMEYLDFAEDLGAVPILGIWSGLAQGNYSDPENTFPAVPPEDLQPYIDDAINELHFVTGDAATNQWAALRAKYGRTEPYNVTLLEIGNEDNFSPTTYAAYRWRMFVEAIEAAFPGKFEFIATTLPSTALEPKYTKIDFHVYSTPEWFITNAHMLDSYPRNGTGWFVGEYAVTAPTPDCLFGPLTCGRLSYPILRGSVAEAAFMTQFERNADVVFASAYAPSLQNIDGTNWTPDLITFDQGRLVKSTSYYVQQMFATNVGSYGLSTVPDSSNVTAPLFWTASHSPERNVAYLKMVNAGSSDLVVNLSFDSDVGQTVSATTLSTGSLSVNGSNTLDNPNFIVPVQGSFAIQNTKAFNYSFPAQSVTVLNFITDAW